MAQSRTSQGPAVTPSIGTKLKGKWYGPNLVLNSGFDANSDWNLSLNASITGGKLQVSGNLAVHDPEATQFINVTGGKTYIIQAELGGANPELDIQQYDAAGFVSGERTTDARVYHKVTVGDTITRIRLKCGRGAADSNVATWDNITLQEVL